MQACVIFLFGQLVCSLALSADDGNRVATKVASVDKGQGPAWVRDFNEGLRRARTNGKDLLVVFTGHGWCANCELLDREVFRTAEFVREIANSFVFVELDFTYGDSAQERQRERVEGELKKRFLAPAVPTVILLDPTGVPYAILEGYKAGTGPQKVLGRLRHAQAARIERDQKFLAAGKAAGGERAALRHAGLQAIAGLFGTLEERGDDPILAFYPDVVSEIRKLDSTAGRSLVALYETRQKKRDEFITTQKATFGELDKLKKAKDYKGAIRFIDAALKDLKSPDLRWRLEYARQVNLEWDSQYAAGLENARRLLAEPDRTPEQREALLGRESYNLWNSGRIADALAQHDRRIREAHHPEKHLRMLAGKAQMVLSHRNEPEVGPAESIKVWREYREATKPKTEDWRIATRFLAIQLQLQGQYRAALKLHQDFLEAEPTDVRARLYAAECHVALGEYDVARQLIRQVEKTMPAKPERDDEKQLQKWTLTQIAHLQEKLHKQSP